MNHVISDAGRIPKVSYRHRKAKCNSATGPHFWLTGPSLLLLTELRMVEAQVCVLPALYNEKEYMRSGIHAVYSRKVGKSQCVKELGDSTGISGGIGEGV